MPIRPKSSVSWGFWLWVATTASVVSFRSSPSDLARFLRAREEPPSSAAPSLYKFSADQAVLLHIGKAGGGSIVQEHHRRGLHVGQCHPVPCRPKRVRQLLRHDTALLVSLRDPVDRAVSAFYYAVLVLCGNSTDDPRIPHPEFWIDPTTRCDARRKDQRARRFLFTRYQKNINRLTDDLCSNVTHKVVQAKRAVRSIEHMQVSLSEWLHFAWKPEHMFAVVMEPHVTDLIHETEQAMHWIYNRTRFEDAVSFHTRFSDPRDGGTNNNRTWMMFHDDAAAEDTRHSSVSVKQELSVRGQACLARYYQTDYELLRQRRDDLCKTQGCRAGIQSMLDRRRRALLQGT